MDRRNFIKLFGATVASASASTVLAGIPEAAPKIQLLEKKEIVTVNNIDFDFVIEEIISLNYVHDENYINMAAYPGSIPGMITNDIHVTFHHLNLAIFLNNKLHPTYFTFNLSKNLISQTKEYGYHKLNGRKFVCKKLDVSSGVKQFAIVDVMGAEIHG